MNALELKIPPVVLFILCALMIWGLARWAPVLAIPAEGLWTWLHYGLMTAAVSLLLASQWQFFRGKTTLNPMDPGAASSLLSTGVFRLSRNPIYLAMLLVLVAIAVRQGQASGLLAAVVFYLWMTRWQIVPEERHLRERFGEEYQRYCQRVRRWL